MNKRSRLLAVTVLLTLTACGVRVHSDQPDYIIEVLYGTWQVVTLETSTGKTRDVEKPTSEMVPNGWCKIPHSLERTKTGADSLPATWKDIPEIGALLPLAALEVPTGMPLRVRGGLVGTCHPGRGVQAVGGGVYWKPPGAPKEVVDFKCIYDHNSKVVAFVDFEVFEDGGTYNAPSYRTFFDAAGDYLYYHMHGMGKRFSLSVRQIDTIAAGAFPIIPWNDDAVVVYSEVDQEYRLLNDTLAVTASIAGGLEGEVLSVYMLDETTFVFACKWVFSPDTLYGGVDARSFLAFFELDFQRGTLRELNRSGLSTHGDILSVERVE